MVQLFITSHSRGEDAWPTMPAELLGQEHLWFVGLPSLDPSAPYFSRAHDTLSPRNHKMLHASNVIGLFRHPWFLTPFSRSMRAMTSSSGQCWKLHFCTPQLRPDVLRQQKPHFWTLNFFQLSIVSSQKRRIFGTLWHWKRGWKIKIFAKKINKYN